MTRQVTFTVVSSNAGSTGATNATVGGWQGDDALRVDLRSANRTDHCLPRIEYGSCGFETSEVLAGLTEQGHRLRPFVGDGGALRIMLIIG